jgi:hypothetical protein
VETLGVGNVVKSFAAHIIYQMGKNPQRQKNNIMAHVAPIQMNIVLVDTIATAKKDGEPF